MEHVDLILRVVATGATLVGLPLTVYNIVSSRAHTRKLARERHDGDRLDQVCVLAAKNEQRLNGLEGRHNSLEARVDRRLEQIAGDVGKVKDLFTDYLINKNH